MSLLMDALKKAEAAKRGGGESIKPELTLKPMTPSPSTSSTSSLGSSLPDLSLHIDSVDADLAAVSTEVPVNRRRAPPPALKPSETDIREEAERSAVRNVFTAKQAPRSRNGLWLFLGLLAFAVLLFGGYFWWQLQSVSVGSLARPVQPLAFAAPTPPALPVQQPAIAAAKTTTSLAEPAALPAPKLPRSAGFNPPAGPAGRSTPLQKQSPAAGQTDADSPVRLSRSQPRSNQTLERAYDALQAGKLDEAQRGYELVLRNDTKNTDALLGLATIAARQGQAEWAQAYYLRALESDPNDATAQAGVISTRGQADPGQSESRLKTALASQPDSSALHFALGNLYARQARWSEAQQSYFRAYSTEPDNADFIFNMAVSLDHLHQSKLAVQYYQMALNAAGMNTTSFDKNQVKTRVLELQP